MVNKSNEVSKDISINPIGMPRFYPGMRSFSNIHKNQIPLTDLDSLRTALAKEQKLATKVLGELDFPNLESLVSEVDKNPIDAKPVLYSRMPYFDRILIKPLVYYQNNFTTLYGIRSHFGRENENLKIRDPFEITDSFRQIVVLNKDVEKEKREFILLSPKEYDTVSKLVADPAARKEYMLTVMERTNEDNDSREVANAILRTAEKLNASDIHLEPMKDKSTRVRYRIDGSLVTKDYRNAQKILPRVISLFKNESKMAIDEKRRPQDGSIEFTEEFLATQESLREYHLRLATMPTRGREKMVIRLLSSKQELFTLEKLGHKERPLKEFRNLIKNPYGLIFVTGPTGSGKSTTLYAALSELNTEDVNIVTIEDPIEMEIEGINQSQVNNRAEWGFSNSLRAYLRQEPDIILVGETRDRETAQATIEAAKTGHLVFSTMHTNDAISVLTRLSDFDVDNSDIQASLTGVVAQRLARVLCPDCKEEYDASAEINELAKEDIVSGLKLYKARKSREQDCTYCNGLGYKGRTVVPEIWVIGEEERDLIGKGERSMFPYQKLMVDKGLPTLLDSSLDLVLEGVTTLNEIVGSIVPRRQFEERKLIVRKAIETYSKGK